MITALDHIAVAVPDLEKAIKRFIDDFGLTLGYAHRRWVVQRSSAGARQQGGLGTAPAGLSQGEFGVSLGVTWSAWRRLDVRLVVPALPVVWPSRSRIRRQRRSSVRTQTLTRTTAAPARIR